jgi:hypothetical protein
MNSHNCHHQNKNAHSSDNSEGTQLFSCPSCRVIASGIKSGVMSWIIAMMNTGKDSSKLTRGSSQINLTLIETETRVQAYLKASYYRRIFLYL